MHLLNKYGFNPKRFQLELMEEALGHQMNIGSQFIPLLKESGIELAVKKSSKVDTALVDLDKIEFKTLKIDQDIIKRIQDNYRVKVVMETLIDLTQRLGIQTSAEGIDNRTTFDLLRDIGCQSFQGGLVGAFLSLRELEEWFISQKSTNKNAKLGPKRA